MNSFQMAVIKTVLFPDSTLFPARIFFRRIAQFFHNGIHNNDTIRYAHVSFSTRALSLCLPAAEQQECEIAYDKPLPTTTIEIVTLHFFFFLLRGYGEAEFFFPPRRKEHVEHVVRMVDGYRQGQREHFLNGNVQLILSRMKSATSTKRLAYVAMNGRICTRGWGV